MRNAYTFLKPMGFVFILHLYIWLKRNRAGETLRHSKYVLFLETNCNIVKDKRVMCKRLGK